MYADITHTRDTEDIRNIPEVTEMLNEYERYKRGYQPSMQYPNHMKGAVYRLLQKVQ